MTDHIKVEKCLYLYSNTQTDKSNRTLSKESFTELKSKKSYSQK